MQLSYFYQFLKYFLKIIKDKLYMFVLFISSGVIRLQDFLKEAQKNDWRVQLYQFRPSQAYRDIFWRIKSAGESRIVLDVKRDSLRTVLKHVRFLF